MSVGFKLLLSKKSAEQAAVIEKVKLWTRKKSKLLNEKTNCSMHMQLLHKQLLDIKLKSGIIAYIKMIVEWNC